MMRCCCSLCLRASHSHGQMSACYEIRSPDQIISRSSLHQRITEELTHTGRLVLLPSSRVRLHSQFLLLLCLPDARRASRSRNLSFPLFLSSLTLFLPHLRPACEASSLCFSLFSRTLALFPDSHFRTKNRNDCQDSFSLSLSLFLVLLFVVLRESV